jgi:hypothetical protein
MASIEQIKQMINAAAEQVEAVAGQLMTLEESVVQAQGLVRDAFEGAGNQQMLEAQGTLAEATMDMSETTMKLLGAATSLRDSVAFL